MSYCKTSFVLSHVGVPNEPFLTSIWWWLLYFLRTQEYSGNGILVTECIWLEASVLLYSSTWQQISPTYHQPKQIIVKKNRCISGVCLFCFPPRKKTCGASLARKPGLKKAGPWTAEWNSDIFCVLFSIIRRGVAKDISMILMIPLSRWKNMCFFFLKLCVFLPNSWIFLSPATPGFWKGFGRVSKITIRWLHDEDSLQVEMVCAFNTIPRDVARNTSWFVTWQHDQPGLIQLSSMRFQGVDANGWSISSCKWTHEFWRCFFPGSRMCQHVSTCC